MDRGYSYHIHEQAFSLPLYVCTVGVNHQQNEVLREHGIEHHQLLFCRTGRGLARIDGNTVPLAVQDVFYLPPHTPHVYEPETNGAWRTDWISFGGPVADALLPKNGGVWHPTDYGKLTSLVEKIRRNDLVLDYRTNSVCMYELLLGFQEEIQRKKGINIPKTRERLQPVLTYMQQHFAESISIRELAAQLDVTDEQFCRIFHSVCHTRPMAYLQFLRINHAKKQMSTQPGRSINDIALSCGFGNASYFGRIFLRMEGVSATVWRKQHAAVYTEEPWYSDKSNP